MVEEVKLKNEQGEIVGTEIKGMLKVEGSKYINLYYRAEGTFMFSLIALLLAIFLWDTVQDPLFFFMFTVFFNLLLMLFFLFKHFKQRGVF